MTNASSQENDQYCFELLNGSSCFKTFRSTALYVTMYIFMALSILITVCGNLAVVISISHFKQLHSPTNFLVLSLAVADFLMGFIVMPYSMIRSIDTCWYFGDIFCKIHSSCDMMLSTASIFHLCFIAVDRYYAVCDPLRYTTKITTPVILLFLVISWTVPILFAFGVVFSEINLEGIEDFVASISCKGFCVLLFNKLWGILAPIVAFFIPGTVMVGIYVKIYIVAKKHAKVINSLTEKVLRVKEKNKISKHREKKASKTLAIVMGVFLFCWSPFFVTTIADPFLGFSTPAVLFESLVWLGYFNSAFNPIIYGFFYPWFQKALKAILTCQILGPDSSTINLFPENF
ncbi:trace amine-associated receptor 4-like [Latimeria chalumnae]|uniref:trace amine-associated receptor 4-like n=1 Tax=Latimeria chalumnae TaxID=7897 RepID=UPI00313C7535